MSHAPGRTPQSRARAPATSIIGFDPRGRRSCNDGSLLRMSGTGSTYSKPTRTTRSGAPAPGPAGRDRGAGRPRQRRPGDDEAGGQRADTMNAAGREWHEGVRTEEGHVHTETARDPRPAAPAGRATSRPEQAAHGGCGQGDALQRWSAPARPTTGPTADRRRRARYPRRGAVRWAGVGASARRRGRFSAPKACGARDRRGQRARAAAAGARRNPNATRSLR